MSSPPPTKKFKPSFADCPICLDVDTKYLQCKEGHSICGECFSKLTVKTCPTCRGNFHNPPTRNRMVENYVQDSDNGLVTPCLNKVKDCPFVGTKRQLIKHASQCRFLDVYCPVGQCKTIVELHLLEMHVVNEHKFSHSDLKASRSYTRKEYFFKSNQLSTVTKDHTTMLTFDGRLFYHCFQINRESEEIYTWVSSQSHQKYTYKIEIAGSRYSNIFKGDLISLTVPKKTVYQSEDCLSLPTKMLKKLLNPITDPRALAMRFDKKLSMKVHIIRK